MQRSEAAEAKTVLRDFLDRRRAALLATIRDLDDRQGTLIQMPSGTTLVGIVSHLAWMERWWFEGAFAGEAVAFPWTDDDPDADWRPAGDESVEDVIERYRTAVSHSNDLIDSAGLDDLAQQPDLPPFEIGRQDLRWIMVHMLEETAQHVGHAEILRELTLPEY